MVSFVIFTMLFAYLAGFGKFERNMFGYPKRLLNNAGYTKIEND